MPMTHQIAEGDIVKHFLDRVNPLCGMAEESGTGGRYISILWEDGNASKWRTDSLIVVSSTSQ